MKNSIKNGDNSKSLILKVKTILLVWTWISVTIIAYIL